MLPALILAVVCCLPHVGLGDRQKCKRDELLLRRQTKGSSARTLLDRTIRRKPGFIPVHPKNNRNEWDAIKTMFFVQDGTALGVGRDTKGWDAEHGKYDDLQVIAALRLQYSDESESVYRQEKETLSNELRTTQQTSFTAIKGLKTRQSGHALVNVLKTHGIDVNPALNEALLFHATKDANVLSIIDNGLKDSRCGPSSLPWFFESTCDPCTNSLFGCGVYLADQIEKADQYATAVSPDAQAYDTINKIAQQHGGDAALRQFMYDHNTSIFYTFIVKALLGKTATIVRNASGKWAHLDFKNEFYRNGSDEYHSQFIPSQRTNRNGIMDSYNEVTADPFGRRTEIVYVVAYTRCKGSGFLKKVERAVAFQGAQRAWKCKESMMELKRLQNQLFSK